MREDMHKIIIDTSRYRRGKSPKTKIRFVKDDRHRITGRQIARQRGEEKWVNDRLKPLKRYLFKQRGRKWDDVFSEICACLDTGSTVKMHVLEHIDHFILRQVRIDENGQYRRNDGWSANCTPDLWWRDVYVCPLDGRVKETAALCRSLGLKHRRRYSREPDKAVFEIKQFSKTCFLLKRKGLWFEIETDREPLSTRGKRIPLYVLETFLFDENIEAACWSWQNDLSNRIWSVVSKRQLPKIQLEMLGLKNGGKNE